MTRVRAAAVKSTKGAVSTDFPEILTWQATG